MEKVILIFSFMDIGVNIISGKERVREEGRGGVGKKANKLQHVQIPESFHQGEQRHEWQVWLVASWGDTEGFAGTNISLPTPNGMAAPAA